jgi:hypothetical protein
MDTYTNITYSILEIDLLQTSNIRRNVLESLADIFHYIGFY